MAKIIRISKEEAHRRLGDVEGDKRFWCQDGKVIKNLKDLEEALNNMTDDTFHHHSGEERNDFSNWISKVVGDEKLARDVSKAKSRMQASKAVALRVSFLRSKT